MTKRSRLTPKKQRQPDSSSESDSSSDASRRIPLWQAFVLPIVAILVFFLLLEGGLTLFGVKPALKTEDPFVGFASNIPLFVPSPGPIGSQRLITAENKLNFFNPQSFMRVKAPGSYRIFCLGGSTTYGRPYNDTTSFAGWLRELLPVADRNKNWEVINAGGISYASYRVAHLMEELVNYQPDLFIIYTGHNEFLEERTYSQIRDIQPVVQLTISLLARTRTWSAMTTAMQEIGIYPQAGKEGRDKLAGEVNIILDRSAGPERYTRDDHLRENILQHYRNSLERMVSLARSVGAQVIFVTPASQLKDCTPFKSEHTQGLDPGARHHSEKILIQAKEAMRQENWNKALDLLEKEVSLDPRHAELQYRRGQVLLILGRFEEAEIALRLARDEDVCPLRALTSMRLIVTEIANNLGVGVVDYVDLLERHMLKIKSYPIPGEEFFLDHVHPTIEGHKILAVALIQSMIDQGLVQPGAGWGELAIAAVAEKIEGRIDPEVHGKALASLARVLLWAGKNEDAARLARQALDTAGEYPQIAVDAASTLASYYQRQGNLEHALQQLYSALENAPGVIEPRLKLGETLLKRPFLQLDEAAAHLLLASQKKPYNDVANQLFGEAMVWRGRLGIAYGSLMEALRLNPKNKGAQKTLDQIRPLLVGRRPPSPQPHKILLDVYPSLVPRKLVQVHRNDSGNEVRDGIEVEFYENGRVKHFLDIDQGVPNGLEITWDTDGRVLSRVVYQQGTSIDLERALQQLYSALENAPGVIEPRLKLGETLLKRPFLQLDEAAAHLLLACQKMPYNDVAYQLFGEAMAQRGRLIIAYGSLMEALRLNPKNNEAQKTLDQIRPLLRGRQPPSPQPHKILLDVYPSLGTRKLVQVSRDDSGNEVRDGIEVEFYENGRVKRFLDIDQGVQDGLEIIWDTDGRVLSRVVYQQGTPVNNDLGK